MKRFLIAKLLLHFLENVREINKKKTKYFVNMRKIYVHSFFFNNFSKKSGILWKIKKKYQHFGLKQLIFMPLHYQCLRDSYAKTKGGQKWYQSAAHPFRIPRPGSNRFLLKGFLKILLKPFSVVVAFKITELISNQQIIFLFSWENNNRLYTSRCF